MTPRQPRNRLTALKAIIALLAALSFLTWRVGSVTRTDPVRFKNSAAALPPGSPLDPQGALAHMDPELGALNLPERLKVARELNLSISQAHALQKATGGGVPSSLDQFKTRRDAMKTILTPAQMEQIDASFVAVATRRLTTARHVLPPDEYDKFNKKLNDKIQQIFPGSQPLKPLGEKDKGQRTKDK